jgi:preprotein translocase subunit SecF
MNKKNYVFSSPGKIDLYIEEEEEGSTRGKGGQGSEGSSRSDMKEVTTDVSTNVKENSRKTKNGKVDKRFRSEDDNDVQDNRNNEKNLDNGKGKLKLKKKTEKEIEVEESSGDDLFFSDKIRYLCMYICISVYVYL